VQAVDPESADVIQGTLEMLILKTLSLQPLHAFGGCRPFVRPGSIRRSRCERND
jgi:hypothetical protein